LRDQFPAPSDRERLIVIVQRREVQAKLKEFGVSGKEALARVNSMTDGEIASIFRQIEQYAPAGADPLWRESGEKDPGYIFTIIVVLAVLGCLAFCWLLFV
nr:PA2779 family protein [Nitrospinaceae bacterium]NIR54802.1 PA2779 family protein [Nitrospinaceae bacterium]NIS85227.1 PA2779 family protein [Nitrospinaceae bacterium]NIT82040.1 PA2779 family protein [Nitrospinaceae bacterium]NIU44301.1 PA2779 family protein [Nitrospinaceae bacterium]